MDEGTETSGLMDRHRKLSSSLQLNMKVRGDRRVRRQKSPGKYF